MALLTLRATHFFEKHLFDVRKISAVSQIASVTSQACTVITLILLSYAMQIASSDIIVRRRQSLAALHDNLMAWQGLGSSILAVWRSRKLDIRTRLRVLLAFVFFVGVSVLQIVTPSVMTVGTFNATLPISLNVSTMLNIQPWMFSLPSVTSASPTTATSSLWTQLGTNTTAGLPAGVNGSVVFSTLPSVMTEDVVFQDSYARDLSVRCGIIPRESGDLYQVSYIGPVNDTLINLPPIPFDDAFSTTFAYISARNDSLKLNPTVNFSQPLEYTLQVQTWSFINNDTKNAFHEDVNATFYIWPIACSLFAQNITADVQGDNTLMKKNTSSTTTDDPTPFLQPDIPHDPLEIAWGSMMSNIYLQESEVIVLLGPTSQSLPRRSRRIISNYADPFTSKNVVPTRPED
ncbi:hypothetical protein BS47DRAFT_1393580 [Hydnum rufescens UP504]|uniref:Transmembrane protein n=1 Tax=Hydnum rufescens UP504 TaxID=1448309 RepID=A0A9P6AYH0_9AGAM|nr:hypothetical protein BS47DRAFT_1393580 [Hydnum rufescens UP504]